MLTQPLTDFALVQSAGLNIEELYKEEKKKNRGFGNYRTSYGDRNAETSTESEWSKKISEFEDFLGIGDEASKMVQEQKAKARILQSVLAVENAEEAERKVLKMKPAEEKATPEEEEDADPDEVIQAIKNTCNDCIEQAINPSSLQILSISKASKLPSSMASSDLSGEDFMESLGISLDDVDLTADADTHASVTGIFAQSLENMAHLAEYDWAGAILSRMYDDMCDLSQDHCKVSGTYYFWETWAFEYFPYTRPELIHADLGLGLVPLAWRWYRSNLHTIRRKKSLRDLGTFFDTCTLEQVGAMTARLLAARLQSWIQVDSRFQRSDALSQRRVVLSHPVLRRYYLGERVDL
ncbi:hypothetical protein JCGZ_00074 [Jatropha curcas]|uniref:Aminotransferase-like plant mobile domain-containing protein n=1 Tax=Jatropha curcas TaxID=180498 RepID=A0A067JIZ4_JATCU|nr:hypothetical protein JCGZ_00074 [Jatropha curcas]